MNLIMDLSKSGLEMFFKPYQVKALHILWESRESLNSRQVWVKVNEDVNQRISRASTINSLNSIVELGILNYEEVSGKGGYHRIYSPKYSKFETKVYLSNIVKEHLQTLLK